MTTGVEGGGGGDVAILGGCGRTGAIEDFSTGIGAGAGDECFGRSRAIGDTFVTTGAGEIAVDGIGAKINGFVGSRVGNRGCIGDTFHGTGAADATLGGTGAGKIGFNGSGVGENCCTGEFLNDIGAGDDGFGANVGVLGRVDVGVCVGTLGTSGAGEYGFNGPDTGSAT